MWLVYFRKGTIDHIIHFSGVCKNEERKKNANLFFFGLQIVFLFVLQRVKVNISSIYIVYFRTICSTNQILDACCIQKVDISHIMDCSIICFVESKPPQRSSTLQRQEKILGRKET